MPDTTLLNSSPIEAEKLRQLKAEGLSQDAARATLEIDRIMSHIRRSMARRELGRMAIDDLGLDLDISDLDILHLLETRRADAEITVGTVAERLGVDPSRASRIVSDSVTKGLLRRVASQADARRICLELTDRGAEHAVAIRKYKLHLFAEALGEWPEEDLVTFARLFDRFSHWVADARTRNAGHRASAAEKPA